MYFFFSISPYLYIFVLFGYGRIYCWRKKALNSLYAQADLTQILPGSCHQVCFLM